MHLPYALAADLALDHDTSLRAEADLSRLTGSNGRGRRPAWWTRLIAAVVPNRAGAATPAGPAGAVHPPRSRQGRVATVDCARTPIVGGPAATRGGRRQPLTGVSESRSSTAASPR